MLDEILCMLKLKTLILNLGEIMHIEILVTFYPKDRILGVGVIAMSCCSSGKTF